MTTIKEAFDEFIISKTADGLSAQTLKWYSSMLVQFIDKYADREIQSVTRSEMRGYIVELGKRTARYINATQKPKQDGGLSEASIEGHKRALFSFWSWSADEYDIDDPMSGIKRKKRIKSNIRAISYETLKKLIETANKQDEPYRQRDVAILYLLADTGIRAGGLCGMNVGDIDLIRKRIIVFEKGDEYRNVPFTDATALQLIRWFAVRPVDAESFFCGFQSGSEGNALTVSGINQILKRLAKLAEIKDKVSPHRIRHFMAEHYLLDGGGLADLSKVLGHKDVNTTVANYGKFSSDAIHHVHEKHSPITRLNNEGGH